MEAWDRFYGRIAILHAPEVVELSLTLAQVKALYLVAASPEPLHLGALSHQLETALSTTSGVVDRLVQTGLVERSADPVDRARCSSRHAQRRPSSTRCPSWGVIGCANCSCACPTTDDVSSVERTIRLLTDAADDVNEDITQMSFLSRLAVNRRTVILLLAAALFGGGIVAWSNLKQELLPDVSFPIATVIAPYPGAAADDVATQVVEPIERRWSPIPGIDQVSSTSANSIGFVIAQFAYGTDIDQATAAMEKAIAALSLPPGVEPGGAAARHQRLAGPDRVRLVAGCVAAPTSVRSRTARSCPSWRGSAGSRAWTSPAASPTR